MAQEQEIKFKYVMTPEQELHEKEGSLSVLQKNKWFLERRDEFNFCTITAKLPDNFVVDSQQYILVEDGQAPWKLFNVGNHRGEVDLKDVPLTENLQKLLLEKQKIEDLSEDEKNQIKKEVAIIAYENARERFCKDINRNWKVNN